jgi:hypothetical protein
MKTKFEIHINDESVDGDVLSFDLLVDTTVSERHIVSIFIASARCQNPEQQQQHRPHLRSNPKSRIKAQVYDGCFF